MPLNIYHEKQSKQLCALHALNNLFQDRSAFAKAELDLICQNLSPNSKFINPHKSALGFGNYDINVIMSALHKKHCEAIWFDKRKHFNIFFKKFVHKYFKRFITSRNPQSLELKNIKGFILNIPNPTCNKWSPSSLLSLPATLLSRKHWIALRRFDFDNSYYNLDSKLDYPEVIGDDSSLITFLKDKNNANDTEIFVVVSSEIAESASWIKEEYRIQN